MKITTNTVVSVNSTKNSIVSLCYLTCCAVVLLCIVAWTVHGWKIYMWSIWTDGRSRGQSQTDKQQTIQVRWLICMYTASQKELAALF